MWRSPLPLGRPGSGEKKGESTLLCKRHNRYKCGVHGSNRTCICTTHQAELIDQALSICNTMGLVQRPFLGLPPPRDISSGTAHFMRTADPGTSKQAQWTWPVAWSGRRALERRHLQGPSQWEELRAGAPLTPQGPELVPQTLRRHDGAAYTVVRVGDALFVSFQEALPAPPL